MGAKLDGNVLVMKQIIVSGEKETLNSDIEIQLSKRLLSHGKPSGEQTNFP